MTDTHQTAKVWQGRPVLGRLLQLALALVPFVLAVVVTLAISSGLGTPTSRPGQVAKIVLLVSISAVVMLATDKVAKLATPVAVLLRISMVFPDRAPSRVRVAMRCSSEEELRKTLLEVNAGGLGSTANEAAETLMVLVAALSRHDRMTRGHSERTRAYADVIAGEMGLSTEDRSKLRWAALLHDVGKMRIPEEILNKPDRLTDIEYEIVKQHPVIGAELAEPLREFLGPWADTIVQHHERWDGGGYPAGLAGDEICLGARIVAVADTFDVITSLRSYKKPQTASAAREEIARHSGTQFDPEVVKLFLGISIGRFGWSVAPLSMLSQFPQLVAFMSPVAGGLTNIANAAPVMLLGAATMGSMAAVTDVFEMEQPVDDELAFEIPLDVNDPDETSFTVPDDSIVVTLPGSTGSTTTTNSFSTDTSISDSSTTDPAVSSSTTSPSSVTSSSVAPTTTTTKPPSTTTTLAPIVPQAPNGQLPAIFGECMGQRGITAAEARSAGQMNFGDCELGRDGPLNLSNYDLTGMSVVDGDWTGTNFSNAKLDGVTFSKVAMWQADFTGVTASGMQFFDFGMGGSTFANATITNSVFERGDLGSTSFNGATLSEIRISLASISSSTFAGATIRESDLGGVEAYRTSFADSTIKSVNLSGANLTEATFDRAAIDDVEIRGSQLWSASFVGADIVSVLFDGALGTPALGTSGRWEEVSCNDGSRPAERICPWS